MLSFLRMRWLFNRYVAWSVLWIVGLILVATIVNIAGIELAGDVQSWSDWLNTNASIFLIWRICLYCVVGYGWYWMRSRVIAREGTQEAKQRFLRIEVGAVAALLLLEITNWTN